MRKSKNLQLGLLDGSDLFDYREFNKNFEKLDENSVADDALSDTSERPVQNKVIYGVLDGKALTFSDIELDDSSFVFDPTYKEYPYKAVLNCQGVTTDHVPVVIFNVGEALSGKFAPVSISGKDSVSIFASEKVACTIASVVCVKGGV